MLYGSTSRIRFFIHVSIYMILHTIRFWMAYLLSFSFKNHWDYKVELFSALYFFPTSKLACDWSNWKFTILWSSVQIRYAYELLTNPILKRDYDLFGLDEHTVISRPSSLCLCACLSFESLLTLITPVFLTGLTWLIPFYLLGCPWESQRTIWKGALSENRSPIVKRHCSQ